MSALSLASCRRMEFGLAAFWEAIARPSDVRGPVDLSHGCQRRMASACLARRSGDQHEECEASLPIDAPISSIVKSRLRLRQHGHKLHPDLLLGLSYLPCLVAQNRPLGRPIGPSIDRRAQSYLP